MRLKLVNCQVGLSSSLIDIYIEDGLFVESLSQEPDIVIDGKNYVVTPGLIDVHCHLREPGFEYREDIISGTLSAAKGGFTSICPMPNTKPVTDNASIVSNIIQKAREEGFANVFPIGAATKGLEGLELAEYGFMKQAGIVGVSDDGRPIQGADLLIKSMQYAQDFGLLVMNHCEEMSLAKGGAMNESAISTQMGLNGIPTIAEDIMISRDLLVAEYLDLPIHICHVSTQRGVELIREAKKRGVKVTSETCPHYFVLTEEACLGYNTDAKMNPPLRTEKDKQAIIRGLQDGTIDMIVTDHAPHHEDEKRIEFALANNGIVGFETAFALSYTYLVKPGYMDLDALIKLMTLNPSSLLHLQRGQIKPGLPADVSLFDINTPFRFDKNKMLSKGRNTPFHDWELWGETVLTICGGKITYQKN